MKTIICTGVSLTGVITALAFCTFHRSEPEFEHRPLSLWLKDLDCLDKPTWHRAETAIGEMGTNSLPTLKSLLHARDSFLKRALLRVTEDFPAINLDSAEAHYDSALEACRILCHRSVQKGPPRVETRSLLVVENPPPGFCLVV
jgi:hypothetical protein